MKRCNQLSYGPLWLAIAFCKGGEAMFLKSALTAKKNPADAGLNSDTYRLIIDKFFIYCFHSEVEL